MYLTDNLADVMERTKLLHPQARFAASLALNEAVRAARDAMPSLAESVFDRPTAFTQQGFYTTPSRKDDLQASIGVKDKQSEYMRYQVEGGTRAPKKKALRLPHRSLALNEFGNLPAGYIRQLVARAKAGKRATAAQSKRYGVSRDLDLFYGEPGDGRPAGLYKRVVQGSKHHLVPLVLFPKQSAKYERRFDFYGAAQKAVRQAFQPALARAWERALKTAR